MTDLAYMRDTYCFSHSSTVESILSDGDSFVITMESTIFHPQGGGQPSDVGTIRSSNASFLVSKAMKGGDGIVHHHGRFESEQKFNVGEPVDQEIDAEKRVLHGKLHSGGHLLDLAMQECGWNLPGVKGYHFPDGAYVEFAGEIPPEQKEDAIGLLQEQVDIILSQDNPTSVTSVEYSELSDCCLEVPSYFSAESGPIRVVRFGEYLGCACGGTHVSNLSTIGELKIEKIQKKKKNIRIKYSVQYAV